MCRDSICPRSISHPELHHVVVQAHDVELRLASYPNSVGVHLDLGAD